MVYLHGTVESERFHDKQEFVLEYKTGVRSKEIDFLPGWGIIFAEGFPPSLLFCFFGNERLQ